MMAVARDDDRDIAVVVDSSTVDGRSVHGVDPWLGLVEVHGTADAVGDTAVAWADAVALAQLAVGHELVGASRRALALAREHALERIQFGQPIARFQAVRHRLAETLVAIETASAVLDAAWLDRSPVTAAMAKATAGRSARTAARHCQQVLAGIGFTTEHDLHRYVRRILVLDQLFGSHTTLTKQLGEQLLVTRSLPRLLPL
jgi:alkylation response protein AidB-like acyl-CoA dehydrogenase